MPKLIAHLKWVQKNKKYVARYGKQYGIQYRYGINYKQFKHLLLIQNNQCLICKKPFTKRRKPYIDHNHITKKLRGILCLNCNFGISHLMADNGISILLNAIKYVKRYKGVKL